MHSLFIGQPLTFSALLTPKLLSECNLLDSWKAFCDTSDCVAAERADEFVRRVGCTHFDMDRIAEVVNAEFGYDLLIGGDLTSADFSHLRLALGRKVRFKSAPDEKELSDAFRFVKQARASRKSTALVADSPTIAFADAAKRARCRPWSTGEHAYQARLLLDF